MKLLKLGGYLNILIAIAHIIGLLWAQDMYDYTGVGEDMRRNAEIHPLLPTAMTVFVSIFFFIFGIYGLSAAKAVKEMPFLKIGVFSIAAIYLLRGIIGSIVNIGFETSFQWHHLFFSLCALAIGFLYLIGGLQVWKNKI